MIKVVDGEKSDLYNNNKSLIDQFFKFSAENLKFNKPVDVRFLHDEGNAEDPLGKTAFYNPDEMSISIYITGRHVKDILRSISHELIHHVQNCRGDLDNTTDTEEGYAQRDDHMRDMEHQAYTSGNIMNFRDFEDNYKKRGIAMLEELKKSRLKRLHGLLMEQSPASKSKKIRTANQATWLKPLRNFDEKVKKDKDNWKFKCTNKTPPFECGFAFENFRSLLWLAKENKIGKVYILDNFPHAFSVLPKDKQGQLIKLKKEAEKAPTAADLTAGEWLAQRRKSKEGQKSWATDYGATEEEGCKKSGGTWNPYTERCTLPASAKAKAAPAAPSQRKKRRRRVKCKPERVRTLQNLLKMARFKPGASDDKYGSDTQGAIDALRKHPAHKGKAPARNPAGVCRSIEDLIGYLIKVTGSIPDKGTGAPAAPVAPAMAPTAAAQAKRKPKITRPFAIRAAAKQFGLDSRNIKDRLLRGLARGAVKMLIDERGMSPYDAYAEYRRHYKDYRKTKDRREFIRNVQDLLGLTYKEIKKKFDL
jgi:hypothetical protein